jgi:plasmid stabilization system protein ParE
MTLRWSMEARRRLEDIRAYLAEESPELAERTLARLIARAERLTDLPGIGHRLENYPNIELGEVLERPYRIIYQHNADQIEIVTVLHYRQLIPKQLGQR